MLPEFVTVHRRAWTAFDSLSDAERDALAAKLKELHELPVEEWARQGVRQGWDSVYYFHWIADWVVFFSVQADGAFVIEDFAPRERLEAFAAASHKPVVKT